MLCPTFYHHTHHPQLKNKFYSIFLFNCSDILMRIKQADIYKCTYIQTYRDFHIRN